MPVRSLTQEEARDRAALLVVDRYDVLVDLSALLDGTELRATSRVTFRCRQPGARTFVDCAAEVVSATLNGVELPAAEDGRILLADLAEQNTLLVESVQRGTLTGEGVHKAVDPADGETYLWTSFEPDEARYLWACFDQPDLKAPWAFTVVAPDPWTVLSNSGDPVVEALEHPLGTKARRWSFPATPPLSSYNPVVLAGPFHEVRREVDGYDLGLFARRSLQAVLERDAEELLTLTAQGLAFFGERFQMPFPQRKYDQVFLPEFGGAMENYGCVAWSDTFLRRAEPTEAEWELTAKVLLHEMAHMWFGNIVTMRWWDDLWLNEAYAEFAANWAAERATRFRDAWASHLVDDERDAYLSDQGPTTHPIRQPVHDVAQAASMFDAITYPKGASVLLQLMALLGEDRFCAGMAAYFAKHAWKNTTLQDLVDELAAASGEDLAGWRSGWLETAGADRLALERVDGRLALVATGPDGGPPRPHRLVVGAYQGSTPPLERVAQVEVQVSSAVTPVELPEDADLYLPNDEDLTFARVRPDAEHRAAFLRLGPALPTALSRGLVAGTAWDMLANAEAAPAEVAHLLAALLRAETADAVVEPYLRLACEVVEDWSGDDQRPQLAAEVSAALRDLLDVPPRRTVALRGLARLVATSEEVTWLQGQVGRDVDLQWRLLVRKAELGGVAPEEVQSLLRRDPDPDAWVRALTVQAATPSAEDKAAVWETVAVDRRVPVGVVGTVAAAFLRPGQEALLMPYAERYLDLLPRFEEGGMIPAMVYTGRLFPRYGIDDGFLDRAERAGAELSPVVRRTLLERVDRLRRMLAARALGVGAVR